MHIRASQWYEDNGLELEAFHHAAAANDVERAERLIEGDGIPLHFRGVVTTILDWLASLPTTVLDARPSLWVRSATLSLVAGQTTGVEEKLQAAEAAIAAALQGAEPDDKTRDLIGQIAAARATLALSQLPDRNHHCPVAPRPGVSAPRQPAFPLQGKLDAGEGLPFPGRTCRSRPGLCRSLIYRPGVWGYSQHHIGYNLPGPDTGIGKPALSGGRDLPALPCNCLEVIIRLRCQRSVSWPGPYLLRMERSGCRRTARRNRASNWRGSMIKLLTDSLSVRCFSPA